MEDNQTKKVYTPEENARDAQKWRELQAGVKRCLDDSSNGFTSIWGGDDNLYASVKWQSRGQSGMEVTLNWTAANEVREDLDSAVQLNGTSS